MPYHLFVYNPKGSIEEINEVISTHFVYWDKGLKIHNSAHYLQKFDAEAVKAQIEKELDNKCVVWINSPFRRDEEQREFISVTTSFSKIHEVLPKVHAIVAENDLVLYDAERRKTFFRDLLDDTFIQWKTRERDIRGSILSGNHKIWSYQKLASDENKKESSFVITLHYREGVSLEERTQQFCDTLKKSLVFGEELVCENRCFTVYGEHYSITFCLEAYKKHPHMIGFYEDGQPKVDLLRRMSCFEAFRWVGQCNGQEKSDINACMNFIEMEDRYKNSGDRFVCSVNILKRQRKDIFDIHYGVPGYHGSAVVFHVVPSQYSGDNDRISALILGEETASFILPFVNDVYPYIYERYYEVDGNHLPAQMWQKIIDNLLDTEYMIVHDTFNPKLEPYIEQLELYENSTEHDRDVWKNNRKQFLFEHRYDVAHLYDIFIEWSNAQIRCYGDGCIFNIEGP